MRASDGFGIVPALADFSNALRITLMVMHGRFVKRRLGKLAAGKGFDCLGESQLLGFADPVNSIPGRPTAKAQIKVSRDAADNIVAEVEFAKDGPSGYVVTSRLEVVDVGKDDDGETITSCVVVESEVQRTPKQEKANKGLTKTARTALRVLTDVLGECGTEPPPSNHIPPRVRVTTVETWRRYCYQRGISTGEDRAKQKAFKSAAELLVANGQVAIWGDHVWIS